jgi:hypothetical protein
MLFFKESLSAQALACMEKLKALDLSLIAAYLMNFQNRYGWTRQQAYRAIGRYKTFLFITYLYPQIFLVPTQEIDQVWHCHILHTRKYRQDCKRLFGCFIDHEPNSQLRDEANQQNTDVAFAQTQALLVLFNGYFQVEMSVELEVYQSIEIGLAEYQLQQSRDDDNVNLYLYQSACGRPKSLANSGKN